MDSPIDAQLVRHIGKLSRIELTEEQVQTFSRQLAATIEHVGKLKELDTSAVEPMAHAGDVSNALADDVPGQSLSTEEALANAPRRDGSFFKVPKVIEDD